MPTNSTGHLIVACAKVINYDLNGDGTVNDQSTIMDDIGLTKQDLDTLSLGEPAHIIDWLSDNCGVTVPVGTYIDDGADYGPNRIELVDAEGNPVGAITWEMTAHLFKAWDNIGVESFAQLGRAYYKGTACGCWMQAWMPDGSTVGYEDEEARNITAETLICGIKVGSIVEGCDTGTDTWTVTDPAKLAAAIQAVEDEAKSIWDDTHGCATCAAHWVAECGPGAESGEFGGICVWLDCPDCGGNGICI